MLLVSETALPLVSETALPLVPETALLRLAEAPRFFNRRKPHFVNAHVQVQAQVGSRTSWNSEAALLLVSEIALPVFSETALPLVPRPHFRWSLARRKAAGPRVPAFEKKKAPTAPGAVQAPATAPCAKANAAPAFQPGLLDERRGRELDRESPVVGTPPSSLLRCSPTQCGNRSGSRSTENPTGLRAGRPPLRSGRLGQVGLLSGQVPGLRGAPHVPKVPS